MNILLCCSAGMSTSLLVTKMQESAEKKGIDANIWAISAGQVENESEKADIILLGPQVRYLLTDVKKIGERKGIPIDTINPTDYGMMKGENVLLQAIKKIESEKE